MIEAQGAQIQYLPPYSPDLNPIEVAFHKLKTWMRKIAARDFDLLCMGLGSAIFQLLPPIVAIDRIRQRLSLDGVQAVIPPISTRASVITYDKECYRQRNRVERFFNKIKQFRRIATRYDKLSKTFFAAVHLVAAFLIARNS